MFKLIFWTILGLSAFSALFGWLCCMAGAQADDRALEMRSKKDELPVDREGEKKPEVITSACE